MLPRLLPVAAAAAALVALPLSAHAAPAEPHAATATFQVVTDPAGDESGWTFTLVGPGTPAGGEKLTTTGAAPAPFATPLQAGLYTIAETTRSGWDQSGATGCVFTVAYPADADRTFACQVSDVQEGDVTATVTHGGGLPSGTDAFHLQLSGGPDDVLLAQVAQLANLGHLDFGLLRPGSYKLCQQAPASGWSTTLVAQGGIPDASGDICLPFTLAPGQAKQFTIDNTSPAATPTPAPTAMPTPTPSSGVQGVTTPRPNAGSTSGTSGGSGSSSAGTGGTGAVAIPNTGVGLSGLMGGPLILLGGALLAVGRRRRR